ncbi:glycosyltransferase family A protein [Flavobacterium franklandianum]|uniref:glycosyltransferase family A protein n=1 Tax=Flavobacterium franklandianum TaxID=2594430 RepID=UPI00163D9CC2|nr:glycosyltransferase family A protein [Flavobacterium franklandianum]
MVINQSEENILISDFESVRVINVNEKGLSKSRNLALKNATKKICLIADDDLVYFENFGKIIVNDFTVNTNADIITFNHVGSDKKIIENSSINGYLHTIKSAYRVSSFEIAFKLDVVRENSIKFDENFGLGSLFEIAEEFLFLKKSIELKLKAYFSPFVIVYHPLISSGKKEGADKLIYARSALFYTLKGNFVYLWLIKYVFFLARNKYINWNECIRKYKTGLSGIRKYKEQIKL